jgi:tRNA (mo5U34)-methyltransferase
MGDLRSRVDDISWYHRLELPGGVVTPGVYDPRFMLEQVQLPADLTGRSVLDIGAWDGFWSFEAKRRGAARVVATDSYAWDGRGWGSKEGFLTARAELGFDVEDRDIDVMDLTPDAVGTFDVVLFVGVLYHLPDPIGALERVASVTSELLILETESALSWLPFPAAAVFPGGELNGDGTNWFSLNQRAIAGLLRGQGFSRVERVWHASFGQRAGRAVRQLVRPRNFAGNRIAFHAYR